jgi:hypothetical protein
VVQAKLEQEWSPEHIAGYLRATLPDRPSPPLPAARPASART